MARQIRVREQIADRPNQRWSMDFMQDRLVSGKSVRVLNVLDEGTREGLASSAESSFPAGLVIRVLEQVGEARGFPCEIWIDNGPEFRSKALDAWAAKRGIGLHFIRPGKPIENCYIESFNATLRRECLDAHWFESLPEVRRTLAAWLEEYNENRPHTSLGGRTPAEFAGLRALPLPPSALGAPQTRPGRLR